MELHEKREPSVDHVLEELIKIGEVSSISKNVSRFFTMKGIQLSETPWITDEGFLNWNELTQSKLVAIEKEGDAEIVDQKYFRKKDAKSSHNFSGDEGYVDALQKIYRSATRIKQCSQAVHQHLLSLTKDEFIERYGSRFIISAFPDLFIKAFESISNPDAFTMFGCMCGQLERALGDLTTAQREASAKQGSARVPGVPYKLREVLESVHLQDLLGPDKIYFLRIFVGVPFGINARNLFWHGFLNLSEFPREYTSLMMMLILSLHLENFNLKFQDEFSTRPSILQLVELKQHRPVYTTQFYQDIFPPFFLQLEKDSQVETSRDLNLIFENNPIVPKNRISIWNLAIGKFLEKDYLSFMLLLAPQLEHSLRLLFSVINEVHEKVTTAESDVVYITLKSLLSPYLDRAAFLETATWNLPMGIPTGPKTRNRMVGILGKDMMHILADLLYWPMGPCLRDRFSHATVSFHDISPELADHSLQVAVGFSMCFLPESSRIFPEISARMNKYRSRFHPKVLSLKSFFLTRKEFFKLKVEINTVPTYKPDLEQQPVFQDELELIENFVEEFQSWISTKFPENGSFQLEEFQLENIDMTDLSLEISNSQLTVFSFVTRISRKLDIIYLLISGKLGIPEKPSRVQLKNRNLIFANRRWLILILKFSLLQLEFILKKDLKSGNSNFVSPYLGFNVFQSFGKIGEK
eukprot:TRINITY_DN1615_c3_g1_i1.p1 TRINITY_DN1615_c3_g1~~TRINITY_DN1615_c3_g1_i1.p1  ORF type:complete len:694 (+),score=255.05 TRINITY_DN1615_c3_g1_i1:153-2234(+)